MGTILNAESFKRQFDNPSAYDQGLITGLYNAGCLVGSILAIIYGEKLGRKRSMYVAAWIVVSGTILQCTAQVVAHLIASRVFTGVGIGILTAVVPAYQAEVSPADKRGAAITMETANIIMGFVLSNWLSFGASFTDSGFQWIFPISLQALFSIYLLLVVPFLCESPRWLANHRSMGEATNVLARLLNTTEDDSRVQESCAEIEEALEHEDSGSFREIFTERTQQNLRRVLLGIGALYMQQMSGINTVGYYLPMILQDQVGLSRLQSAIVAGCGAIFYYLFALPPIWLIDKVGRRPAMVFGAVGLTIVNAVLCVGFNISGTKGSILVIVMYFLYYAVFAVSFLNVPWMYPPEINTLRMRSMGGALASCSNWLCMWPNFLVYECGDRIVKANVSPAIVNGISVTITPIALTSLGWKFYLMWMTFNASFIPLIYFCYPETKGLPLEQIDHIFEDQHPTGLAHLTQGVRESIKNASGKSDSSGNAEKGKTGNKLKKRAVGPLAVVDSEGESSSSNLEKNLSDVQESKEFVDGGRTSGSLVKVA